MNSSRPASYIGCKVKITIKIEAIAQFSHNYRSTSRNSISSQKNCREDKLNVKLVLSLSLSLSFTKLDVSLILNPSQQDLL
jgi:hypothetical protein